MLDNRNNSYLLNEICFVGTDIIIWSLPHSYVLPLISLVRVSMFVIPCQWCWVSHGNCYLVAYVVANFCVIQHKYRDCRFYVHVFQCVEAQNSKLSTLATIFSHKYNCMWVKVFLLGDLHQYLYGSSSLMYIWLHLDSQNLAITLLSFIQFRNNN